MAIPERCLVQRACHELTPINSEDMFSHRFRMCHSLAIE
jgi:hypothetical protein